MARENAGGIGTEVAVPVCLAAGPAEIGDLGSLRKVHNAQDVYRDRPRVWEFVRGRVADLNPGEAILGLGHL
jgi:hypothetical protein